ncbi:hypothetical protein [Aneurinibacillus sp. REN35]|uniref:hypothetical protein n=1 Tax=Aneurinibacillus sp. REN35 TaxID=3237286 RepID=UPI003526E5E0
MIIHCIPFTLKRIAITDIRIVSEDESVPNVQGESGFLQVEGPDKDGSYVLLTGYNHFYSLQHRREKSVLCKVRTLVSSHEYTIIKRKHDDKETMIGVLLPYYEADQIAAWTHIPLHVVKKYEKMLAPTLSRGRAEKNELRMILDIPYIGLSFKRMLLHNYVRKNRKAYDVKFLRK